MAMPLVACGNKGETGSSVDGETKEVKAIDNKVYLAQFFRVIDKEKSADIYKLATDSPYYIGAVHENEPENGEKLVNICGCICRQKIYTGYKIDLEKEQYEKSIFYSRKSGFIW